MRAKSLLPTSATKSLVPAADKLRRGGSQYKLMAPDSADQFQHARFHKNPFIGSLLKLGLILRQVPRRTIEKIIDHSNDCASKVGPMSNRKATTL